MVVGCSRAHVLPSSKFEKWVMMASEGGEYYVSRARRIPPHVTVVAAPIEL